MFGAWAGARRQDTFAQVGPRRLAGANTARRSVRARRLWGPEKAGSSRSRRGTIGPIRLTLGLLDMRLVTRKGIRRRSGSRSRVASLGNAVMQRSGAISARLKQRE